MNHVQELGLQPQFWILPTAFFGLVVLSAILLILANLLGDGIDGVLAPMTLIFGGIGVAFIGVAWFVVSIPFNSTYQHYYSVSGKVEAVTNGFSDGSGDTTARVYVVRLGDDARPYQLYDARITQLKGENVSLTCTVGWVDYGNSADQWDCNIRSAPFTREDF